MGPSQRSSAPPFTVMEIVARANALKQTGRSVLTLCVGEPGGGAPSPVRQAAREALDSSLAYSDPDGLVELREAISGHYSTRYGVAVDPARIVVTTGASGGFLAAFVAAFDAGDRVAVARPGYPAYRNTLESLGCVPVDVSAGPRQAFALTLAALQQAHRQQRLNGVVIASPSNPTGSLTVELPQILSWCAEEGIRVLSDEIYHGITFGSALVTTAAPDPWAITIGSFSKFWGMTGWRLGWLVLPADLRSAASAVAGNLALCAPVLSQRAAVAAFTPQAYRECEERVANLALARAHLLDRFDDLGFMQSAPMDGAFYLWAQLAPDAPRSPEYCARLLQETGVALAPGTDFDQHDGDRWVRLSFSPGLDTVRQACDRIARNH